MSIMGVSARPSTVEGGRPLGGQNYAFSIRVPQHGSPRNSPRQLITPRPVTARTATEAVTAPFSSSLTMSNGQFRRPNFLQELKLSPRKLVGHQQLPSLAAIASRLGRRSRTASGVPVFAWHVWTHVVPCPLWNV